MNMNQAKLIPVPERTFHCEMLQNGACKQNDCLMEKDTYPHAVNQCCFSCPSFEACKKGTFICSNLPAEKRYEL